MVGGTTIQIDQETKAMLADLKDHPRETWGDVVKRLADEKKRESAEAKGK